MSFLASSFRILSLRIVLLGIVVLTDVVLSRYLGPEYKGYAVILTLTPVLLSVLAGLGMDYALNQFGHREPRRLSAMLHTSALVTGVAAVALVALLASDAFGFLSALYSGLPSEFERVETLSLVIIPAEILFVLVGMYVMTGGRPEWFAGMRVVRRGLILALFGAAVLAFAALGLQDAVFVYVVAQIIGIGIAAAAGLAAGRYRPAGGFYRVRSMVEEGLRSYPGRIADRFQTRVGIVLLGILGSGSAVGLISVSAGIAEALFFVSNTASIVLFGRHSEKTPQLHERVIRLMLPTGLGMIVAIAGAAWLVVPAAWGTAFAESRVILLVLLPGVFCYAMVQVMTPVMVQSGYTRSISAAQSVALVSNIGLNIALIPVWGPYGTAWASTAAFAVAFLMVALVFASKRQISLYAALVPTRDDYRYAVNRVAKLIHGR